MRFLLKCGNWFVFESQIMTWGRFCELINKCYVIEKAINHACKSQSKSVTNTLNFNFLVISDVSIFYNLI